jgi:hypothetical protein
MVTSLGKHRTTATDVQVALWIFSAVQNRLSDSLR